jgi:hypothetical protein
MSDSQSEMPIFKIPQISIGIGIALFVFFLVEFLVYLKFPSQRQLIASISAALAAAGAVSAAFYMGKALKFQLERDGRGENREKQKELKDSESAALEYGKRWNDSSMVDARRACTEMLRLGFEQDGPLQVKNILAENVEKNHEMTHILNFFEELSLSVQKKHADEEIAKRLFGGTVNKLHQVTMEWVKVERRSHTNKLWSEFETLHNHWN